MNRSELADAMLKGKNAPFVRESQTAYIDASGTYCWACALGCAVIGHYDGDYKQAEAALIQVSRNQGEYDAFAELLDISPALCVEIEHRHLNNHTIEQIAVWLKTSEQEVVNV